MNEILKLYTSLSDSDLLEAIEEIKYCEFHGFYPENSMIRELAKKTAEITLQDISSNLLMVQMGVLKEGAFRWSNLLNK